ncbi:glycosyltransferase family 4 protein [Mucilaginibacter antarcticus]|uniref:glycosyltransferase family 4 protein n=1 Tax=Mucilaginibacter antarcticus TaxID=1855725 RepID=UPI003628978A
MRNVIFLTGEDMLDVDMPIVKEMNASNSNQFNITWMVVLRGYGWFKEDEINTFCKQNNVNLILLEQLGKLKNPLSIFFHIKVLKILKKLNPDVIYDSFAGTPFLHFLRPLFLSKEKFVIAIHDVVQHYKMKNYMARTFYNNFLMKTYDNFHIFSENQLKIFNEKFKNKKTFCTPLYLKDFGELKENNRITDKKITYFLFFGIIRPNKGLDFLIEAANTLGKRYDNFHVVVAGKCDEWEVYDKQIERPEQFTLKIGNVETDEVPDLLSGTHFLVLPYRDVTQSGVLLTSYNYNIPIIASELEWFTEYIEDGSTGYLFESENAAELAKKWRSA